MCRRKTFPLEMFFLKKTLYKELAFCLSKVEMFPEKQRKDCFTYDAPLRRKIKTFEDWILFFPFI